MARRRCLLVLSVLSGATPVSQAIEEAQISRGTYYQLETRALSAMLQALMPGAANTGAGEPLAAQMARMETRAKKLEKEKRRAERLLLLTRQVLKPGPVTTDKGPRTRRAPKSTTTGSVPSAGRKKAGTSTSESPSTPNPTGTAER